MTSQAKSSSSGFRLLGVYALHQNYSALEAADLEEGKPDERDLTFGWDWKISGARTFDVVIGLQVRGNRSAPEEVALMVSGSFEANDGTTSVSCLDFVQKMAPAILFPYGREMIASLTARGPHGPFHLPAMNVLALMADQSFESSTGAEQLQDVELAREFGLIFPTAAPQIAPTEGLTTDQDT